MVNFKIIDGRLMLIKYVVRTQNEDGSIESLACSEEEKNLLLAALPHSVAEKIDSPGFEWLDGKTFTSEQIQAGEIELAVEMGEERYEAYSLAADPTAQMVDLDYRISLLELGIGGGTI